MSQVTLTESHIAEWIIEYLKETRSMPLESIGPDTSFASLGLDSINQVELIAKLQTWMGCRVEPTLAYDYPTIGSLSKELAKIKKEDEEGVCESH